MFKPFRSDHPQSKDGKGKGKAVQAVSTDDEGRLDIGNVTG